MAFYRQQYSAVEKKKLDKEAILNDQLEQKRELEKELAAKEEQLHEMSPAQVAKVSVFIDSARC